MEAGGSRTFEKLVIYRPGLLRLPGGRWNRRRGGGSETHGRPRILETAARKVSELFDLSDWWSISMDDLAKAMVLKSIDIAASEQQTHDDMLKSYSQVILFKFVLCCGMH